MLPSVWAVAFADSLNLKFNEKDVLFGVDAGRKYDRIYIEQYGSRSVHAFVDRENGNLLKSGTWNAPQKSARNGLAIRYCLADVAQMDDAVKDADPYGSYLYVR